MILQPDDIAIDYSGARPDPAAIVAADVKLVVRYISPRRDNPKNLTVAERDRLLEAGLSLLLVWEHTATDALQGATLGAQHGAMAESFAHDLGNPDAIPVIAAVDTNPVQLVGGKFVSRIPAIVDYLGAFDAANSYSSGAYGNDQVVTAAHDAGVSVLGWQTRAWSAGRRSPHADCLQQIGFVHPTVQALNTASGGAQGRQVLDDNTVLRPFTAWSTSMPTPPPSQPQPSEDVMWGQFVKDDGPGDFWFEGIDWAGKFWTDTIANLGYDWNAINRPTLETKPRAALEAARAVQSRPTPLPTSTGGVAVDVNALAEAVADQLAERLKS